MFFSNWKGIDSEMLSAECRADLQSYVLGFKQICIKVFSRDVSHVNIVPARVNNDAIENIFLSTERR